MFSIFQKTDTIQTIFTRVWMFDSFKKVNVKHFEKVGISWFRFKADHLKHEIRPGLRRTFDGAIYQSQCCRIRRNTYICSQTRLYSITWEELHSFVYISGSQPFWRHSDAKIGLEVNKNDNWWHPWHCLMAHRLKTTGLYTKSHSELKYDWNRIVFCLLWPKYVRYLKGF